jgi:hypothetical protein
MATPAPVKYWVTLRSNEPSGPTTLEALRFWHHRGFLEPDILICEVGAEHWQRLCDLKAWKTPSHEALLRIKQDESDSMVAAAPGPMSDQQKCRIQFYGFTPAPEWTEGQAGLFLDFLTEIDAKKTEEYEHRPLTPEEIDQLNARGLAPEEFDSPLEAREAIDPDSEEMRRAKIKWETALSDRFDEVMEALEFDSDLCPEPFQSFDRRRKEIFELLALRHRDFHRWSNSQIVKAMAQIVLELQPRR